MCNLRTIMMSATGKLLSDKVIDVGSISLNIIDAPAICICVEQNINGYENILFKYSNITENQLTISTESNNTLVTIGENSGCIYTYQFKHDIGMSELVEIKKCAIGKNETVRYSTNVGNLLNLIKHIYSKMHHNLRSNENRNTHPATSI